MAEENIGLSKTDTDDYGATELVNEKSLDEIYDIIGNSFKQFKCREYTGFHVLKVVLSFT